MSKNGSEFDVLLKVVIVGDSGVGKTNYLCRFVDGKFCPVHEATVGFDFKSKILQLPTSKKRVKFQIWDTAGQEKYMALNRNLFQRVQGIILMYDITKPETYENLDKWMKLIKQLASGISLILIGNKIDLIDERKVETEKGEQFATNNNLKLFESSAKSGVNVEESFVYLGEQMLLSNNLLDERSTKGSEYIISKETTYKKNKKKCC